MNIPTYTDNPSLRLVDCEIARHMGWTEIRQIWNGEWLGTMPKSPWCDYADAMSSVPRFHGAQYSGEAEAAKSRLLFWLAQNPDRWRKFDHAIYDLLNLWPEEAEESRSLLLASPSQIATAAGKSLKIVVPSP